MMNRKPVRGCKGKLAVLAAVLGAVLLLAMPAAAATVTASDVMIRNSGEEKDDNIIGVLQEGDKVTVLSRSTDAAGTEWYYIELPNKNTGYVKAQWVDNGGQDVETVQPAAPAEEPRKQEEEAAAQPAGDADAESASGTGEADAEDEHLDDWMQGQEEQAQEAAAGGEGTAADGAGSEADAQNAPETEAEPSYDPFTDPNAQYNIQYMAESDGTGNWYVYNYDTDRHIRLGELAKLSEAQNAAQKSASAAGFWRTIACVLLVLLIALLAAFYFLFMRNGGGRPAGRASRPRRQRAAAAYDDEEDDVFSYAYQGEDGEDEADAQEKDSVSGAPSSRDAGSRREAARASVLPGAGEDKAPSTDGPSGEDFEEDHGAEAGEDGESYDEDAYEDDAYEDEDLEDEEYGDEDEEEEYEEEDYDEEEDLPRGGGLFGFIKSIFSSDGLDDDYDEDYDEDGEPYEDADGDGGPAPDEEDDAMDVEEAPRRRSGRPSQGPARNATRPRPRQARVIEFDEALDYPEDADLLPPASGKTAQDAPRAAGAAAPEAEAAPAGRAPGREARGTAGPDPAPRPESDAAGYDPGMEDLFADEDDDMEYSFLNRPRKRR